MSDKPTDPDLFEVLETDLDGITSNTSDAEADPGDEGDAELGDELDGDDQEALAERIAAMSAEDFAALVAKTRGEDLPERDERLLELEAGGKEALAAQRAQRQFDFAAANELMREWREADRRRGEADTAIQAEQDANAPDPETQAAMEALTDLPTDAFIELTQAAALGDTERVRSLGRRYSLPTSLLETFV